MKYYILTLGCQMNKSDSERVRTVVEGMGYRLTDNEEEANLLGIIACSVRQKSIDKVYSRIARWNNWKNKRNVLTFVSGCVLPADREKFLKLFDLVFAMSELPELPDMIRQYGIVTPLPAAAGIEQPGALVTRPDLIRSDPAVDNPVKFIMPPAEKIRDFWKLQPSYISEYEAFIPIQNGCDKFCTFCAVPYTRGREISRPSAEILEELHEVVQKGYKSITLLGQNVNSYGRDKHGSEMSFPELLRAIGEYGEKSEMDFWVYFTSPHPRDMSDEVLEAISQYRCLARQIHLPLQSGDDKVLIRMNRKHTVDDYMRIITSIRRKVPDATIFTDIIVGFTGESAGQFDNTRRLMEAVRFNMAYIAVYSPRPGAASARWDDDIPVHVKKERLHILTEELTKHTIHFNRSLIGKKVKVLVTGRDRKPGYFSGFTEGRIVVRFQTAESVKPGSFVWLNITSAASYSVEGDLVSEKASLQEIL
jgi:tRNA-2-methylthio-N6-dimethylallyladenosine synthase